MKKQCQEIRQLLDQIKITGIKLKTVSNVDRLLSKSGRTQALEVQDEIGNLIEHIKVLLVLVSMDRVRELLDKPDEINVFGPEQIKATFDIDIAPEDIPPIPFSLQALKRAQEKDYMLVLRVDRTNDNQPLSLEQMNATVNQKWQASNLTFASMDNSEPEPWMKTFKLLCDLPSWQAVLDDEYKQKTPRFGWVLISKGPVRNTETTEQYTFKIFGLIEELKSYFTNTRLPSRYQKAIEEFREQAKQLPTLEERDLLRAVEAINKSSISQLLMPTVQELVYDFALYMNINRKKIRILSDHIRASNLSTTKHFLGEPIDIGNFGQSGIQISGRARRINKGLGIGLVINLRYQI